MKRFLLVMLLVFSGTIAHSAGSYQLTQLTSHVYAALTRPNTAAVSNAMIIIGADYVIVAGAHFSREATNDLVAAVASVTAKPIRYFILTHHHEGYGSTDFDFPPGKEVLMSWQTWKRLEDEPRFANFPAIFFREGMTLKLGGTTLILNNLNKGHAPGNLMVFLPESKILFTSDLFYSGTVGWMGEGDMQEWVLALEFMEQLGAKQIIPGQGPISDFSELHEYKNFMRAFLTEVLAHIERGDNLKTTLRNFRLPAYQHLQDYGRFMKTNIERAYHQLNNLQ